MLKRKQFYIQVWVYPFPFSPPFTFLKLAMSSSNKRLIPKGGPRTSTSTKTEWWTVMAVNPDYASHSATKSLLSKGIEFWLSSKYISPDRKENILWIWRNNLYLQLCHLHMPGIPVKYSYSISKILPKCLKPTC